MPDGQIIPSKNMTADNAIVIELQESDITQTGKIRKAVVDRIMLQINKSLVS